jgi:cobalt-zinc-cadmium resistance protein CzcA
MALSSSAGAEVQRPLATVVIWTFTATILTMVVLPVLFKVLMEKNLKDLSSRKDQSKTYLILLLLSTSFAFAQNSNAELDSLIVKGIA